MAIGDCRPERPLTGGGKECHVRSVGPQDILQHSESRLGHGRNGAHLHPPRCRRSLWRTWGPSFRRHESEQSRTRAEGSGFILWESNAILRDLVTLHGAGTLQLAGPRESALADQWIDWQQTVVAPAYANAYIQLIRVPAEQRNHSLIKQSQDDTIKVMHLLDNQLAKTAFVAGGRSRGQGSDRRHRCHADRPAQWQVVDRVGHDGVQRRSKGLR